MRNFINVLENYRIRYVSHSGVLGDPADAQNSKESLGPLGELRVLRVDGMEEEEFAAARLQPHFAPVGDGAGAEHPREEDEQC